MDANKEGGALRRSQRLNTANAPPSSAPTHVTGRKRRHSPPQQANVASKRVRREALAANVTEPQRSATEKDDDASKNAERMAKINRVLHPNRSRSNSVPNPIPSTQKVAHRESEPVTKDAYDVPDSEPDRNPDYQQLEDSEFAQGEQNIPHKESEEDLPSVAFQAESPLFVPEQRLGSEDLGSQMPLPTRTVQTSRKSPEQHANHPPEKQIGAPQNESTNKVGINPNSASKDGVGNSQEMIAIPATSAQPPDILQEMSSSDSEESQVFGEDSLMFKAQPHGVELFTVDMPSKVLGAMWRQMGNPAWTGDKKKWEEEMLKNATKNRKKWHKIQTAGLLGSCKLLLTHLLFTWNLCSEMPRAPSFQEQEDAIRENEARFQGLTRNLRGLVDKVTGQQPALTLMTKKEVSERVIATTQALYEKIVPMLVLILKELFVMGGMDTSDNMTKLPASAEFTPSVLEMLRRVHGWLGRLTQVLCLEEPPVHEGPESFEERKADAVRQNLTTHANSRKSFLSLVEKFGRCLEEAQENLDEKINGTQRRAEAKKRDELLRELKHKKERGIKAAAERQMQLFFASTQRSTADRGPTSSQAHNEQFLLAPSFDSLEDERLLGWIRKVGDPDYGALTGQFPGRSADELSRRGQALKRLVRRKYTAANMVPPLWCYGGKERRLL